MRVVRKCLSIFFACACVMACSRYSDRVTLINRANKDIRSVSVAIGKSAIDVGPLNSDQSVTMTFTDAGEGGYHLIVRFADGKRLEGDVGYVTVQTGSTDTIDLYDDKIQLEGEKPVSLGKPDTQRQF